MQKRFAFKPPDSFHLSAAIGWIELGNHLEANEELEKITPTLRVHPVVLSLRLEIYFALKNWIGVETISQKLIEFEPDKVSHWISLAYATRRKAHGTIQEAKSVLEIAATKFPKEPMIFYNLACYDSQLGDLPNSKQWLDHAFSLGEKSVLQKLVLDDPDLEPLRKKFSL